MKNKELLCSAGAYLRNIRKEKGISIFKVAKAINISRNYLSEIERGKKNPSDLVLEALIEFYGLDIEEVFSKYGRIYSGHFESIKQHPELIKMITTISTDKRIKNDEMIKIANELHSIYKGLIDRKR